MGRRKIEMKILKNNNSRQVTFSKRRTGLFKKANELGTLCGAEVAILVFSPGGKPFSFGHPNFESISERFLNQDQNPDDRNVGSSKDAKMGGLNEKLDDLLKQHEDEKQRGEMLEKAMKEKVEPKCAAPISELRLHELEKLRGSLEKLRENVKARATEMEASSSLLLLATKSMEEADETNY